MLKNLKKIRGGELLAKALIEKGRGCIYFVWWFNPALEGFMNQQIKAMNCPHEQMAGHLADGLTYKRKPAVCL